MTEPVQQSRLVGRLYPSQYVAQWNLRDGTQVTIRPIRPEDEPLAIDFYHGLSDRSAYLRYFRSKQVNEAAAHEYLSQICCIDYEREMVLVVIYESPVSGREEMVAGARLIKLRGAREAECAFVVADEYQNRGLGTELCRRMLGIARAEGVQRIVCTILPGNIAMCAICNRLGFNLEFDIADSLVRGGITVTQEPH